MMSAWLRRGALARTRPAAVFLGAALVVAAAPIGLRAQAAEEQASEAEGGAETPAAGPEQGAGEADGAGEAKKESFSQAVGRVFSDALSAPLDWVDPDADPDAVCGAPSSKEPIDSAVIERLATAIDETWRPLSEGLSEDTPQIVLEVCIGASGAALERPRLLRPVGGLDPAQSVALLRALQVIETAAPFGGPPTEYMPWRRVIVVFDPSLSNARVPESDPGEAVGEDPVLEEGAAASEAQDGEAASESGAQ